MSIKKAVQENGIRPTDLMILDKANGVRKEYSQMYELINKTKLKFLNATGGSVNGDPRNPYNGADDEINTEVIMLGNGEKGNTYLLMQSLNTNIHHLSLLMGKRSPVYTTEPSSFKGNEVSMVMAKLTQLETTLRIFENNQLSDLVAEIGVSL